jgi:hypothetical protein
MFKIEPKLKKAAMKKAREEGTSFSTVLNFAANAYVAGEIKMELVQTVRPEIGKMLKQASLDYKNGKNLSPEFTNVKDAIAYLKAQTGHAHKVS